MPYPGSRIFDELSKANLIKTYEWPLYRFTNPDLLIRDAISSERLSSYYSIIWEEFLGTRLKKIFDIRYLIIEIAAGSDLLIEKIKKFIYMCFQVLAIRSQK